VKAVRLRLGGATIEQAAARVGLSPPTVIRAFKAYQAGGWEAVPVRARGRHPRVVASARRAHNIQRQQLSIDKTVRSALLGQKPSVVWLTGLPAAGKTTIATLVESRLHQLGHATYLLDGDNVRRGLNRDLGFTDADRVENIRRISEVARLMVDGGLIVLVALISPFRRERQLARDLVADDEFFEVYVNTPLDVAEQRDPKGLYRKARRGELKNFTGIDSPYEPPEHPELEIYTPECEPAEAADELIACLWQRGVL